MTGKEFIQYIVFFIILTLAQVLICNHIVLFNVAMPIIFIYPVIRMQIDINSGWLYSIAFFLGLVIDLFSDTPGVNALACTLLAGLKRPAFYAYVPRDDKTKTVTPTVSEIGLAIYSKYLLTMTAIYCLLVFSIEFFSFADIKEILIMAAGSTVMSFLLLLSIDSLSMPASKIMN